MWIEGTFASTAEGSLIAVLDAVLIGNPNWAISDAAAGTNCKVYECDDPVTGAKFYLKVDDNYVAYAILELWEGWDAVGHVGVGASKKETGGGYIFWWMRPVGFWKISLHDNYFTFINATYCGHFCGRPTLYNAALNIVLITAESLYSIGCNSLCRYTNDYYSGWGFLFDEAGNQTNARGAGGGSATSPEYRNIKGIDGKYHVNEEPVANVNTQLVVGTLPGISNGGNYDNGLENGDTVTIGGVDWMAIKGRGVAVFLSLVRKD